VGLFEPAPSELFLDIDSKREGNSTHFRESRQKPRFPVEVDIQIHPRNSPAVPGYTVEISESGMAAMLRDEVPVGEVVRLEFTLPLGKVEVHALVRQHNAFRYGFQFLEPASPHDPIGQTCLQLARDHSAHPFKRY